MKGFKLSKTGWLLLSAGIFIVILAGLGVTRSQQLKEQSYLEEELNLSSMKMDTIQVSHLSPQLDELQQRIDESQNQFTTVKDRLRQSLISADVTEKFFAIADNCSVEIQNLTNTVIKPGQLSGLNCSQTSISASVNGDEDDIVAFLIALNEGFTTGYVQSIQMIVAEETGESSEGEPESSANFQLIIYSYEGE
jgi:hypothetical protein